MNFKAIKIPPVLDRLFDWVLWGIVGYVVLTRLILPMPSEPIPTGDSFADLTKGQTTLLVLSATTCPACIAMKPFISLIASRHPEVQVRTVQTDKLSEEKDANAIMRLAEHVDFRATPTLLILTPDGQLRDRYVGFTSMASLESAIAR